jgi:hypothetical protein
MDVQYRVLQRENLILKQRFQYAGVIAVVEVKLHFLALGKKTRARE